MKKLTTIEFVKNAKNVHGDRYDYSMVYYVDSRTIVDILCREHGVFQQTPSNHLNGQNCPICMNKGKSNNERFINSAKKIHGETYDYSQVLYKNSKRNINIICEIHGVFEQTPTRHLSGDGCPKCNGGVKITKEDFIIKANKIHEDTYDYSLVNYINSSTKVNIICNIHGIFSMRPNNHLNGQKCPLCENKSIGENLIYKWLVDNLIKFETQKTFIDCKNQKQLPFDFYLPDYNLLIEYDGRQHYEPIKYMGGILGFEYRKQNDKIKNEYVVNNNIKLLRISFTERKNLSTILKNNILIN
jgi:very-short-patch-repair endonuclease